jgi:chromate transporter
MAGVLLQLAGLFAALSLLAFGGGNGVVPAMQVAAVDVHHWMTNAEFLDAFAISRAAPGPGSLIVALVGERAAGLSGALVAVAAMYTPSCTVVYFAARAWRRFEAAPWRQLLERALAPVAVGLTLASGLALMQSSETGLAAIAITVAATLALSLTRLHPLLVLAMAGVVAALGGG